MDTSLTEEEKFGFELGDIEEGLDGLWTTNKDGNDVTTFTQKEDEDADKED